jgi:hypothetical protein
VDTGRAVGLSPRPGQPVLARVGGRKSVTFFRSPSIHRYPPAVWDEDEGDESDDSEIVLAHENAELTDERTQTESQSLQVEPDSGMGLGNVAGVQKRTHPTTVTQKASSLAGVRGQPVFQWIPRPRVTRQPANEASTALPTPSNPSGPTLATDTRKLTSVARDRALIADEPPQRSRLARRVAPPPDAFIIQQEVEAKGTREELEAVTTESREKYTPDVLRPILEMFSLGRKKGKSSVIPSNDSPVTTSDRQLQQQVLRQPGYRTSGADPSPTGSQDNALGQLREHDSQEQKPPSADSMDGLSPIATHPQSDSLIPASSKTGGQPEDADISDVRVMRIFAGEHVRTEATFTTVSLRSSTTSSELVKQALQRFRVPTAEDANQDHLYYLSVRRLEGSFAILRPEEKPLGVFDSLVGTAAGSLGGEADSAIRFYLGRRTKEGETESPGGSGNEDVALIVESSITKEPSGAHRDTAGAWKRLITRPLTTHERVSLISAIFSDRNETEVVKRLSGEDAQNIVDAIDQVCTSPLLHLSTVFLIT